MCVQKGLMLMHSHPLFYLVWGSGVGGMGVLQKNLLLWPAAANNTAGSAYGKIGKERTPRCGAGTHVVKVNVRRG